MCQRLRQTRIFRGSRGFSFLRENGFRSFLPITFCRRRSEYKEVALRLFSEPVPEDLWVKHRLRFRISFAVFLLSLFVFSEYHSGNGDTIIALVITVIVILRQSKKDTLRCFGAEFGGVRILASRRRSVRLGSDSLAAARSHSGSDSRPRLSFIALVSLRYVQGCHSLPSPFESPLPKQKGHRWCPFCFGAPRGIRTLDLPVRSRALYPLSYGRIFSSARIVYHNVLRLSIVKTKILKEKIFIFCAIAIVIYNIFCYNTSVYLKR